MAARLIGLDPDPAHVGKLAGQHVTNNHIGPQRASLVLDSRAPAGCRVTAIRNRRPRTRRTQYRLRPAAPARRQAPTAAVQSLHARRGWRWELAQEARTASISRFSVTLSLTTAPPFCIGASKLTPNSLRLISPVALKPARGPP